MALSKRNLPQTVGGPQPAMRDSVTQSLYPTLWMYLTDTKWDDGSPREPASLLVFMQDGVLKGMLKDKNALACLWVASSTLGGLLAALEASLNDPSAEWRADRQGTAAAAKRIKRTGGGAQG